MARKLFTGALPIGAGGRKPVAIDEELYAEIVTALTEHPTTSLDGVDRPTMVGDPAVLFDSEGKAVADAARYRKPLSEHFKRPVRGRVVDGPAREGKPSFGWVVYLGAEPVTEKTAA